MRRILTMGLLLGMAMSLNAQIGVQPEHAGSPIRNVLKTNPLTLALGDFNVTWEHVVSPKSTINLTANAIIDGFSYDDSDFFLGAFTFSYKYYFTHAKKAVPEGFYFRTLAGILGAEDELGGRLGIQLGYQFIWDSGFVLDLGLGPQVVAIDGEVEGPIPSFFLGVGYAF